MAPKCFTLSPKSPDYRIHSGFSVRDIFKESSKILHFTEKSQSRVYINF